MTVDGGDRVQRESHDAGEELVVVVAEKGRVLDKTFKLKSVSGKIGDKVSS